MSALTPLALLSLSTVEQEIIRHLNRYPGATVAELVPVTNLAEEALEGLLSQMVRASWLAELLENGQRTFEVRYGREAPREKRRASGLLDLF